MKSIALPVSQAARLNRVRYALEVERRSPGEFRGKSLRSTRHVIAIPLGRRWLALFIRTTGGYTFRTCLTHESYNKLNLNSYKP